MTRDGRPCWSCMVASHPLCTIESCSCPCQGAERRAREEDAIRQGSAWRVARLPGD
ncbi:MAG TPA: hypothetical protein VFH47_00495 [Candidatus Thermoplasmatota archaeon]|nr:hypothetical protein [Candidatus Thermoplasmatota archaeon]